jgi:RNA recognition motif-containing protein
MVGHTELASHSKIGSMSAATSSRSSSLEPQENIKRKRKDVTEEGSVDSDDNAQASDTPEQPVLSHAERRRRKKEQKLAANLKEEGSATKKRKLKDGSAKAVVPMKRQHSVWVGNMSFKTTHENLRQFFAEVGEITRINMPTKAAAGPGLKPENRGYVRRRSSVRNF